MIGSTASERLHSLMTQVNVLLGGISNLPALVAGLSLSEDGELMWVYIHFDDGKDGGMWCSARFCTVQTVLETVHRAFVMLRSPLFMNEDWHKGLYCFDDTYAGKAIHLDDDGAEDPVTVAPDGRRYS
ncbi:hypothetical protein [Salipiger sp.]|uniref:hypothetical protein n=1 Tax=Salipiger sp. TaxID=2078585 RepID=UPI003A9739FD